MRKLFILGFSMLLAACGGSDNSSSSNSGNSEDPPIIKELPPQTSLSPATQPASMKGMLEAHNKARAAVGINALAWSSKMTKYAEEWAKHLANNKDCTMIHRVEADNNPLGAGENLYWASPVKWSDGRTETQSIGTKDVAQSWGEEKAYYNYDANTCAKGKQCGHYTQMVWNTTLEVGCGMAFCPDKGQIWVCNYNPPGNIIGNKPY